MRLHAGQSPANSHQFAPHLKMPDFSASRISHAARMRMAWGRARELLASMRFAVALLGIICIASVIGTVLRQGEPWGNYVNAFGPFWAQLFWALQLHAVYSAWWFLLILAFLVVSVSLCVVRHTPKYLAEMRRWREDMRVQSLKAFAHRASGAVAGRAPDAARRMQQQLIAHGWGVKLQMRQLSEENAGSTGCMLAARRGAAHKIGYIAAHAAIVLICLGGLLDGDLAVRAQLWFGGKTPYAGDGLIAQVPAQHWLAANTPSFRANLRVVEGGSASTAVLLQPGGVLLHELPFTLELKKFVVEYYSSGMPRLFASEVVIRDKATGAQSARRIEVNRPAHHGGMAIYQASFDDGGSPVTLQALPLNGGTAFALHGTIGSRTELGRPDSDETLTLEYTQLRVLNVEDLGGSRDNAPIDTRKVDWRNTFGKALGAAHNPRADQTLRNIGPSIGYRLRDSAGQAREFHNYMLPLDLGDGVPVFVLGVRESAQEDMRYLRIPADAQNSLTTFLHLRRALHDAALRTDAVQAYVQGATDTPDANLRAALAQSASRALALFAGAGSHPEADAGNGAPGGLQALSDFIEASVPAAEREHVAQVMLRILSGTLFELAQAARAQAGLPPLDAADERTRHFMAQTLMALSNAQYYPAPFVLMLRDFDQVLASVFQVTRAPGKTLVYLGCLLLCLGVCAMLYIRERRLWVWLAPAAGQDAGTTCEAHMALSSNRRTFDAQQEFDRLVRQLLGQP